MAFVGVVVSGTIHPEINVSKMYGRTVPSDIDGDNHQN
jgi:hypothetical protein